MLLFSNCLDRPGQWFIHPDTGSIIHRGPPDREGVTTFTHYRDGGPLEDRELAATVHAAAAETWRWLIGRAPKVPVQFIERDSFGSGLPVVILCDSADQPDQQWIAYTGPGGFFVIRVSDSGEPIGNTFPDNEPYPAELHPNFIQVTRELMARHAEDALLQHATFDPDLDFKSPLPRSISLTRRPRPL